jgi:hypothetical protein
MAEQAALNQGILQALQAITQQLQQVQANAAAAAGADPVVAPEAVFAATPAKVNSDQIINYGTAQGIKLFNAATEKLPVTFDVNSQGANLFCYALLDRANKSGWYSGEGNILTIKDSAENNRDLIKEYGRLSMNEIKTQVLTYIDGSNRRVQNSTQMLLCIKESLSDAGKLKIPSEADQWKANGVENGLMLFKYIMQKAVVDTRATSSFFRENLTSLDSYITTIDSNIELFNQYVHVNQDGLRARGETTDDLVINLFKAYLNVADQNFVEYIKTKKNAYDEGTTNLEPETLMTFALNKYHILVQEKKWKSLSPQDEQLVALKAQYYELKDANLRLSKSLINNKSSSKPRGKGGKFNKKKGQKAETWKKEPPKDGESQTKKVNNKTYHWCKAHKAWTIHSNNECRLQHQADKPGEYMKKEGANDKRLNKKFKWAKTLAAICEELSDSEDDEPVPHSD